MNELEKFNGISETEKEEFYSNFNTEDITNADCMHVKRVCNSFE